jgi:hypothetical protein
MKTKIYSILAGLLLTTSLFAQAPQTMTYQAVVRDGNNALVVSSSISIRVSILIGSVTGTAVYVETHTTQTNQNGLFDIVIGGGTIVSGNYYTDIYWPSYQYFLKTEIDPLGGNAFNITSTSALLSVPYSNYSLYSGASQYCLSCFQHYVGQLYQGGIIVAVWRDSIFIEHGLIMSLTDLSTASYLAGAITFCDGYSNDFYEDWRLPSQDELIQCFNSRYITSNILGEQGLKAIVNVDGSITGGVATYCSSTLYATAGCRAWNYAGGSVVNDLIYGGSPGYVRAVRNF